MFEVRFVRQVETRKKHEPGTFS